MTPILATMQHFTHPHFTYPEHSIILHDDITNPKYLCEGCMTYGFGTRYHCQTCTFKLHEYCATCPPILLSYMHPGHSLRLVERDHLHDRVCDICEDLIEGLSYRCELCRFDVHPICTQLPETLNHILHQDHSLKLLSLAEPRNCAVCRRACNAYSSRYRCDRCEFDIHIGCVPIQCQNTISHRGIPTYVPPSIFPQQHYVVGYPSPHHFPGPSNMHQYNYNMPQYPQPYQQHLHQYNYNMPQYPQPYQQHQGHGQAQTHNYGGNGGRITQMMFNLVKTIATGVISNVIFGVDVSPFFPS